MQLQAIPHVLLSDTRSAERSVHQRDQHLHFHSLSWGSYKQRWGKPSVSLSQSKTNIVYSAAPLKSCPLALSSPFLLSFGYIPVFFVLLYCTLQNCKEYWRWGCSKAENCRTITFPAQLVILCFVHPRKQLTVWPTAYFLGPHLTFEDPPKSSEIHLVWTVEDHYIFSKAPSHIFHSFSFSGSCRSHRCSTHVHAQSLSQSDVTSKRQQSNRLQQTDFCIVSVEYRGTYTRCDLKGKGKCWNYIPLITISISKNKTPSLSLWHREY